MGDAGGETEGNLLLETVPSWVVDVAIEMAAPKLNKLPFYLLPHSTCQSKQDRQKKVKYLYFNTIYQFKRWNIIAKRILWNKWMYHY